MFPSTIMECILLAVVCVIHLSSVRAAPLAGLDIPTNAQQAQAWRPSSSLVRPNIATNVNFGFSSSVDPRTGLVNLAGGIADGFGLDAGILAKTVGNSVTFTGGNGSANAGNRNTAVGNGGVQSLGHVNAFVPVMPNGLALSKALTQTNAIGPMSHAGGHAAGIVG
ncbi:uncharacterized protein LOC129582890 [Paramacrobiotus metropolitanus]|uniref:uncharacterized protein LOC129582890 n=1 Tax=Paramacrobiotus metropolitanus TaxID=2943436 RepID=UPI0024459811|nr:uncharacterized protein LOC129582890 [Paramacrobiotus metropolitanus]